MIEITRNEITAGKYYLAYLSNKFKIGNNWHICRAPENPPRFDTLIDIDKSVLPAYHFGSDWELFEMDHDEILTHIVLNEL